MAKTHNVCRAWEGLSAAIAALVAPFAWGETLMVTTPTTVTTAATYAHGDVQADLTVDKPLTITESAELASGVTVTVNKGGQFLANRPAGASAYSTVTNLGATLVAESLDAASSLYDLTGLSKIPVSVEKMVLPEAAATANGTFDVLQLNGYTFADVTCFVNENTSRPARYVFNGGVLRHGYWQSAGMPLTLAHGTAVVLEGVNGNPVVIVPTYSTAMQFFGGEGTLETRGDCDVIISGIGAVDPIPAAPCQNSDENVFGKAVNSGVNRSWFRVTSNGAWNWNHAGDLRLQSTAWLRLSRENGLPHGASTGIVRLDDWAHKRIAVGTAGNPRLDLNGYSSRLNGLVADSGCEVTNFATAVTSTLTFGAEDLSGTIQAKITGNIDVAKVGVGILTVTNAALPQAFAARGGIVRVYGDSSLGAVAVSAGAALEICGAGVTAASLANGGAVTVTHDVRVGDIVLESGSTLTIDGATVSFDSLDDRGASVVYQNGGRLCRVKEDASETFVQSAGAPYAVGNALRVQSGTLTFTGDTATNEWWRFRFRDAKSRLGLEVGRIALLDGVTPLYGQESMRYSGFLTSKLAAWGAPRVVEEAGAYSVCVYDGEPAPKDLLPGTAAVSAGKEFYLGAFEKARPAGDVTNLFEYATGYHADAVATSTQFRGLSLDPNDESTWVEVTFRVAAGMNKAKAYSIYGTKWANLPSSWIVESSADGIRWETMDARTGVDMKTEAGGAQYFWYKFKDGQTFTGGHLSGSLGFAPSLAVQVDFGATLDCSYVDAGQLLEKICVDAQSGAGTFKNVVIAEQGTLELVNVAERMNELTLALDVATGVENIANWAVTANGHPVKWRFAYENGMLRRIQPGLKLSFR